MEFHLFSQKHAGDSKSSLGVHCALINWCPIQSTFSFWPHSDQGSLEWVNSLSRLFSKWTSGDLFIWRTKTDHFPNNLKVSYWIMSNNVFYYSFITNWATVTGIPSSESYQHLHYGWSCLALHNDFEPGLVVKCLFWHSSVNIYPEIITIFAR